MNIQRHNGESVSRALGVSGVVQGSAGDSWAIQTLCEAIQLQRRQIESLLRVQGRLIAALSKTLDGLLDDSAGESPDALERGRQEIAELKKLWNAGDE